MRFAVFAIVVLAAPALLMAQADPRLRELGRLVLILAPAVAGLALGDRSAWTRRPRGRAVLFAVLVTLAVATAALAAAWVGHAVGQGVARPPSAFAQALGATLLTSVLEEAGWAAAGVGLAVNAFGRRWGVVVLGLVWAAWHLVPVLLHNGLFPELESAPPVMLVAFVAACVAYRELLTRLQELAGSWVAAAAAHAAPNLLLAGVISAGAVLMPFPGAWPLFPAPGGLVFLVLTVRATLVAGRRLRQARA